ncbi:MAG: hypothetical protein JNK58_14265 [Phycisphaerae bacterium]|nr:hypothetical protein [Phycisphaerae bacterium]
MTSPFPLRAIAGCFALACFAVALLSGLNAGRESGAILQTAILALFVGQIVGYLGGWVMARSFREALESHRRAPVSEDGVEL